MPSGDPQGRLVKFVHKRLQAVGDALLESLEDVELGPLHFDVLQVARQGELCLDQ